MRDRLQTAIDAAVRIGTTFRSFLVDGTRIERVILNLAVTLLRRRRPAGLCHPAMDGAGAAHEIRKGRAAITIRFLSCHAAPRP